MNCLLELAFAFLVFIQISLSDADESCTSAKDGEEKIQDDMPPSADMWSARALGEQPMQEGDDAVANVSHITKNKSPWMYFGAASARSYYERHRKYELSNDRVPEDLIEAIESSDISRVQQALTWRGQQYLHAKMQLGTSSSSRLNAYWRFGHAVNFNHYCSLLHWSVHVASLTHNKETAHSVVSLLLELGANPTVKDGWGHDVFELACKDARNGGSIDISCDSAESRVLIEHAAYEAGPHVDHHLDHVQNAALIAARAYFLRHGMVELSQETVPEELVQAIEAHDLEYVQQTITRGRQYLHAKVQLGTIFGTRLREYWRYGHVAYFNHYCSLLHWAVHVASLSKETNKDAALSVISWLLHVGANPAVNDGWGHDVFELSCTDPHEQGNGVFNICIDYAEYQLLVEYARAAPEVCPMRLGHDLGRCKDAPWEINRMRHVLAGYVPVKLPQPSFQLNSEQAAVLVKKMQALDPSGGPAVDDHMGTPIGQGFTIGLLAAHLSTNAKLVALLPDELQTGLFDGRFNTRAADVILRISHTNAAETDLMRMALKVNLGDGASTQLTFTETIKTFPIGNKQQLDAFIHGEEHGTGQMVLNYFTSTIGLAKNAMSLKSAGISDPSFNASVLGKSYYSLTPFAIGRAAAKLALKSDLRRAELNDHKKSSLQAGLIKEIAAAETVFDLMVQLSVDAEKQPVEDCSVLWDERMTPFIKMGELRIPKQELHGVDAPNAGMSKVFDGHLENTKQLMFGIGGRTLHEPLGYVNQFRAQFYPIYDDARQKHFLGDKEAFGVCPMNKAELAMAAVSRMLNS